MTIYGNWELSNKNLPEQFFLFSEAYLDSAKRLCVVLKRSTKKASYQRGCVVIYLTFHATELFLKGAILAKCPKEKLSHDIQGYYDTVTCTGVKNIVSRFHSELIIWALSLK